WEVRMQRRWIISIATLLVLVWLRPVNATDAASRCEADELRAARQKADCVVGERTKAARDGRDPSFEQCETQFDSDLQQAQQRATASGAVCPVVTDAAALAEYLPREGDEAVVFIHSFSAATFDQGQQVVGDGFSHAIDAFGQVRRTYFM